MFNEEPKVGMEIKQTKSDTSEVVFENPYIEAEQVSSETIINPTPEPVTEPEMPSVVLYRTKDGIQKWLDDKEIAANLAMSKGQQLNDDFVRNNEAEIKALSETQPEGREISSVFEILEPGDFINHQVVVSVENRQVELDYFGTKSVLTNEHEIFSILIKDEINEWKRQLEAVDIDKLFADKELIALFRAVEILCINVNMEDCEGFYCVDSSRLGQRLVGMMAASLRKPIYDDVSDIKNKKIISFSVDYEGEISGLEEAIHLYHLSLTNTQNLEVIKEDRVVLC